MQEMVPSSQVPLVDLLLVCHSVPGAQTVKMSSYLGTLNINFGQPCFKVFQLVFLFFILKETLMFQDAEVIHFKKEMVTHANFYSVQV